MKTANAKTLRAQGLSVRKLVLTAMLGALGFVLSTFVYFPSMAPFQHFCNVLGAVYVIPQSNPIAFTHLFWQQDRFDETDARGSWIFGRRGNSCIGVWCSVPLQDHDETMFGCEKRAMGPASAYLVVCGSTAESGSFDAFCQSCLDRPVAFDTHTATLHCAEFDLPFTAGSNGTQILD